ncbi:MAG: EAL domain-containing protein [Gammaproteobacteria bacterium]|nr:EAL domain-containing protein [Gammaproteobacteria bacterium]
MAQASINTFINAMRKEFASWISKLNALNDHSLQRRYLYAAALFVTLMVTIAITGQQIIKDASDRHLQGMHHSTMVSDQLRDLLLRTSDLETAIQRFIITPNPKTSSAVKRSSDRLGSTLGIVQDSSWVKEHSQFSSSIKRLGEQATRLRTDIDRLIEMRRDIEEWFPAMRLMIGTMQPISVEFTSAAGLALEEAYEEMDDPKQQEIYRAFSAIRHGWLQLISEYRLYIANRFGVFVGNVNAGIEIRTKNITLYLEKISRLLNKLDAFKQRGQLQFVGEVSLDEMKELAHHWQATYIEVAKIINSEYWRMDLVILRHNIEPLLTNLRTDLLGLQQKLEIGIKSEAKNLSINASRLSMWLWIFCLAGILATIVGHYLFRRSVLIPLASMSTALRDEASDKNGTTIPKTNVSEIQDMVSAFDTMREQVHMRQQRLEIILDNAAEGIITIDKHGTIETFNNAAEHLFGYRHQDVIGKNISTLTKTPIRNQRDLITLYDKNDGINILDRELEMEARRQDGTLFVVSVKVSETIIQGNKLFTAIVADISERKSMIENLRRMAERDGLTGLYNREYFQTELQRVVERCRDNHSPGVSLLYVDLDNFKYVNDTQGHAAGDKLLIEVSGLLKNRARKGDLVARFGGDEFIVLLYDTNPTLAFSVAESFRKLLADYVYGQGAERVDVGCSIGVTNISKGTTSADDALSQADLACHLAKRNGRNQVYQFNPADQSKMNDMTLDMGWSLRIKDAIERNRFTLMYQPIVSNKDGKVHSYEVLLRMLNDNNDIIMPSGFLPSAERFGLAEDIDRWVITHTIEAFINSHHLLPGLRLAINLSAKTLTDFSVCELIHQQLKENQIDPARLTFEITETVAIADMSVARSFLAILKELGCRTALDDFGSGFTSFAYLRELPVDELKIDGRYIKNIINNTVDQAMVKAMNEVAHTLNMVTIAEFVEDEACLNLLQKMGIDYSQGYHLAQPDTMEGCIAAAHRQNEQKKIMVSG